MRRMIPQKQIEGLEALNKHVEVTNYGDNVSISASGGDSQINLYNANIDLLGERIRLSNEDSGADYIVCEEDAVTIPATLTVKGPDGKEMIHTYSDEDGKYIDMSADEISVTGVLDVKGIFQASNFKISTNSQAATVNAGVVHTPIRLLTEAHCAIIKIAQLVTSVDNFENIYVKMAIDGAGYYIAPIYGDDKIAFLVAQFAANELILSVINIDGTTQTISTCTDVRVRWLNQY